MNSLEIISIHIPKTAGTSLLNGFEEVYGRNCVTRLVREQVVGFENNLKHYVNPNTKVLLGHFYFSEIDEEFLRNRNIKLITWIRDPIERLISNYNFFIKRCNINPPNKKHWDRRNESLSTYASLPGTRNFICKYLQPFELDRFAFIGQFENYTEDLYRLSKTLGIRAIPEMKSNSNKLYDTSEISEKDISLVSEYNQEDIINYKKILQYVRSQK